MRATGVKAEALDDHFPPNTPDTEWLAEAGKRDWVVLSKDLRMSRDSYERQLIISAGVRAFILSRQDLTGPEMAELFVKSLPGMLRRIRNVRKPFIYSISRGGTFTRLA